MGMLGATIKDNYQQFDGYFRLFIFRKIPIFATNCIFLKDFCDFSCIIDFFCTFAPESRTKKV